ncbi:FRG domain-containing protein [Providencia alcalifaciens]|uniref:FRG domain-containing protein n=1 Tax=Providencia TaxID=586 RepID=UPI0012B577B0|nr:MULTISPECIES: FRG domain-containing protein [Providencia]MTC50883.1 FRG domain-containing protein [Providencia alcalifaciens]
MIVTIDLCSWSLYLNFSLINYVIFLLLIVSLSFYIKRNNKVQITCVQELVSIVDGNSSLGYLYRGESDFEYKLKPSLARYSDRAAINGYDLLGNEKYSLQIFNSELPQYHKNHVNGKFELMAIAQHHGLPTRLLDWSLSPLVALYFAVNENKGTDASLYSFRTGSMRWATEDDISKSVDENEEEDVFVYQSKHLTPRLKNQQGVFTFHKRFEEEFNNPNLQKYRIPVDCIDSIKWQLIQLGITDKVIYGDLDALCKTLAFSHFKGFDERQ